MGNAGDAGDLWGNGDVGVDEVGLLVKEAVLEGGMNEGNFDDAGEGRLEACGFDVDEGEGLGGEVAVVF